MKKEIIRGFEVFDKMPEGWVVASTQGNCPRGYSIICNNKTRFSEFRERLSGVIKTDNIINRDNPLAEQKQN